MKLPDNPTVHGASYRNRFRSFVIGVLGAKAPPVHSFGTSFYNQDAWTARVFVAAMCSWAQENPNCCPTERELLEWIREANACKVLNPQIVIARTPDTMTLRTAMALVGGAYHEAFHTRYSCRRQLQLAEMKRIVLPRWARVANWGPYYDLIQQLNNIIEDIRIERRGQEDYPGSVSKLHDLQDFILQMERNGAHEAGRQHTAAKQKPQHAAQHAADDSLTIILKTFRDIGLGYATAEGVRALEEYEKTDPKAFAFVVEGPLAPILRESINLPASDDLGCIRLALDIVVALIEAKKIPDLQPPIKQPKPGCPECGAPAEKLKVRSKVIHSGVVNPSKGVLTCTVCGWQQEVMLEEGAGSEADGGDRGEGRGGKGSPNKKRDPSKKGGEKEPEPEKDPSEPKGFAPEEPPKEGDPQEGTDPGGENSPEPQGKDTSDEDWSEVADKVWDDAAKNPTKQRVLDNNKGLNQALQQALQEIKGDLKGGERPWCPYRDDLDEVVVPLPSSLGQLADSRKAELLFQDVRLASSAVRSRLQTMFRAKQMVSTYHGLRRGKALSDRRLIPSIIEMKSGRVPTRAFRDRDEGIDLSMAAAIVVDESASMGTIRSVPVRCVLCGHEDVNLTKHIHFAHKLSAVAYERRFPDHPVLQKRTRLDDATRILMMLVEPLSSIGCSIQVSGVRDGQTRLDSPELLKEGFHRVNGIRHDLLMSFGENFHQAKWRFTRLVAQDATPLSDGIQFGLDSLRQRPETHQFIFVVTDGLPSDHHKPVVRWQLRRCAEQGVCIMGIGIGKESKYVQELFPDDFDAGTAHAYAEDMDALPLVLIEKLSALLQTRMFG